MLVSYESPKMFDGPEENLTNIETPPAKGEVVEFFTFVLR